MSWGVLMGELSKGKKKPIQRSLYYEENIKRNKDILKEFIDDEEKE